MSAVEIDFQNVVDAARDGVAVFDLDGRYVYVNPAAVALARSRREAMLDHSYRELWPALVGTPFDLAFRRVAAGGPAESAEALSLQSDLWIRYDLALAGPGLVRCTWHEITERKRLEEERQRSIEHLGAAVDAARLATWEYEPDRPAMLASPRLRELMGLGPSEPLTLDLAFELCHPDDRGRLQAALAQAAAGEALYRVEHRIRARNGIERWVRSTGRAVSRDGKLVRLVGCTVDFTGEKRREQRQRFLLDAGELLNSSRDLEETLQKVARLAIGAVADACVIDLFEGGALRRVAAASDAWIGDPPAARISPDGHPAAHPIVQASRGKTVLIAEYSDEIARASASSPGHLEAIRASRIRSLLSLPLRAGEDVLGVVTLLWRQDSSRHTDEDLALAEELTRHMALATDSSRRHRQLQDALRDTLQIVELVEQSRDFIGFASLDGKALFLNHAGLGLVGATREEVVGKHIAQFFMPEDLPAAERNIERVMATGASEVEVRFRHFRTGAPIPVVWNVFLLRNTRGEPDRLATITRDLTEKKRVEREREELIERQQRALHTADMFVGILGHDLRNPLSAILTRAQILQTSDDARVARNAERIRSSGTRMSELIEDLLDFTRIRMGHGIELHLRPADLLDLCLNTIAELRDAYPSRRIECGSEGDCAGVWDPDRVAQVVSNLVGNAVQHSPPESPVIVMLEGRDPDRVQVRVHNDGPPIPDDVRAGLFDPFKRAAKRRAQGLGLGLYISHQIARLHGGRIEVRSSEREGTDFVVELPRRPAGFAATQRAEERA